MSRRHPGSLSAARGTRQAARYHHQLNAEAFMSDSKSLEVQQKKELVTKGEKTAPTRYYVPTTDIVETPDALLLTMEMPGVDRKDIDVKIEDDVLRVEGRIDAAKYDGFEPLYTEYNVG